MAGIVNISTDGLGKIVEGIGKLGGLFRDIRIALTGKVDPDRLAELETLFAQIQGVANSTQAEVNKAEAGHPSVFVAGWRPFIGWTCGTGLGFEFVLRPVVQWVVTICGSSVILPHIETGPLIGLVSGMLGTAALRTYEGLKDKKRETW